MQDEVAAKNERHWERMVDEGCGFTEPWLDLDRETVLRYVEGQLEGTPEKLTWLYPAHLLAGMEGKEVLCLASGGGQQSAVFALLGARVTVVDLTEGQLERDRTAAAHYGYEITTIKADMRDLSNLDDESFDLVYQAESMAYVPDVMPVYKEVARVLRPGGKYRVSFCNPAVEFVDFRSWDGECYHLCQPYAERTDRNAANDTSVQFRHFMRDIFNGLVAVGLAIRQVEDDPACFLESNLHAPPGTWEHSLTYISGSFAVVAEKEKGR